MKQSNWFLLIIVLLCLLAYAPKLSNGFLEGDDQKQILYNVNVSSNKLNFFGDSIANLYRPLRTDLYSITHIFFGYNPVAWQSIGLIMHIIVAALIFFYLTKITKSDKISFVATSLWAIHPILTEKVAGITASYENLGLIFLLASLLLFIKFRETTNKNWLVLSLLSGLVALFSAEDALMIILLIPLTDWMISSCKGFKDYFYYVVIGVFYYSVRTAVIKTIGRGYGLYWAGSLGMSLIQIPKTLIYYIWNMMLPNPVSWKSIELVYSVLNWQFWLPLVTLITLFTLSYRIRDKNKIYFFACCWFIINLVLTLNIIPNDQQIAERYLYLSTLAFTLLIATIGIKVYDRVSKSYKLLLVTLFILLLCFYGYGTFQRTRDYHDPLTFELSNYNKLPNEAQTNFKLGEAYQIQGDWNKTYYYETRAINLSLDSYYGRRMRYTYAVHITEPIYHLYGKNATIEIINHFLKIYPSSSDLLERKRELEQR